MHSKKTTKIPAVPILKKDHHFYSSEPKALHSSIEDIGKIPVKVNDGGIPVFIRDVAEVRIGHAVRYGAMTYKDKGEVSGAVVMMLKGENASQVITRIKERMDKDSENTSGGNSS